MARYDLTCPRHRANLRVQAMSERYCNHPLAQVLLAALDLIERLERGRTEDELRGYAASPGASYSEMFASVFGKRP